MITEQHIKKHEVLIMAYYRFPNIFIYLQDLYEAKLLDHWNVEIRPPFTACDTRDNGVPKEPTQLCVTFESRSGADDWFNSVLILIQAILKQAPIEKLVIKSGMKGHELNKDGTVVDSWDLDDGMC